MLLCILTVFIGASRKPLSQHESVVLSQHCFFTHSTVRTPYTSIRLCLSRCSFILSRESGDVTNGSMLLVVPVSFRKPPVPSPNKYESYYRHQIRGGRLFVSSLKTVLAQNREFTSEPPDLETRQAPASINIRIS